MAALTGAFQPLTHDGTGEPITSTVAGAKRGLDVNLVTGDIEIGAVELKDATTDDRSRALPDGTAVGGTGAVGLMVEGYDDVATVARVLRTDGSGNLQVVPAPGASTDVNVHDGAGNSVTSTAVGLQRGLDVNLLSGDIEIGAVEMKNGASDIRGVIQDNGSAIPVGPNNGGLLVAGRDNGTLRHMRTGSDGRVHVSERPGPTMSVPADTAVGIGATVALPVPPAGTRSQTIQLSGTGRVRVRPAGGVAGTGFILPTQYSSLTLDKAVVALEAEHVGGAATSVLVLFEGD